MTSIVYNHEQVWFSSAGTRCAADLLVPQGGSAEPRPSVVIGRGFNAVKEMSWEHSRALCEAGFVVLSIDYRGFGASEGEDRGNVFPLDQVEDLRNAVSYLQTRSEADADRIGIYGNSLGGGLVIYAAAVDRRIKAVVSVVPVVNGRRWMQALRSRGQWEHLLNKLEQYRLRRFRGEPVERIPIAGLANDNVLCALPADQEVKDYLEGGQRHFKTMRKDVTLESIEKVIEFNPEAAIHQIAPRALCIIAVSGYDIIHPMEHIQRAFAQAGEPRQLSILPYTQFELYEGDKLPESLSIATEWFRQHL